MLIKFHNFHHLLKKDFFFKFDQIQEWNITYILLQKPDGKQTSSQASKLRQFETMTYSLTDGGEV